MVAPFVGLHGLPRLMSGQRAAGLVRLAVGLAIAAFVVGLFGSEVAFGMMLFEPWSFLFIMILCLGGYLFLWVEGLAYAFGRLPPLL
jgi:hypothetical protein